jgi:glycosyltransferase involved in cell wall biosynthesis
VAAAGEGPPRTDTLRRIEAAVRGRSGDPDPLVEDWRRAIDDPALRVEARVLAPRVVAALRRIAARGSDPDRSALIRATARTVARRALTGVHDAELRTRIDLERLHAHLDLGEPPREGEVEAVVSEAMRHVDARLAAGGVTVAAGLFGSALAAALHRNLHCEDVPSPLAADPDTFLAPLRDSAAHAALSLTDAPSPPPARAAHRVLVVAHGNFHFARGISEHLRGSGVDVRELDTVAPPGGLRRHGLAALTAERFARAAGVPAARSTAPQAGRVAEELLRWADTVFVDWCGPAAVWASLHVPLSTRLIVRLHSVEALSVEPFLVDWAAVDDVVFVGAHIRDLVLASIPVVGTRRVHVLPNEMRLAPFAQPKRPAAERTLALVGWASTVKDPQWALDVLELLRGRDPAWRLLLVGPEFPDSLVARGWDYRRRLEARLAGLEPGGHVRRLGHRGDLPDVLRDVGVIVSASLRESFHVGLFQGAASAALPVVRDWPYVARWGGPRTLVPADWVVGTPEEAARRVLRLASAPGGLAAAGAQAQRWVTDHYDWSVVAPRYDALFLDE